MAWQNVHVGNGNNIFVEGTNSQVPEIFGETPDGQHQSSFFDDQIDLGDLWPGFDQLSNRSESSTSVDSNKRKNSGGRPKKIFTLEELVEFKDYTLEAAAKKLNASPSTVKRRVTELTGKTWLEFQQSLPDSHRLRGKERMQDEDKTVIAVYYNGDKYLFDLKPRRFQKLEKLLEKSFNLPPKTYHVKYLHRQEEHTVFNSDTLKGCLSLADQSNPIKLQVEVIDADKHT